MRDGDSTSWARQTGPCRAAAGWLLTVVGPRAVLDADWLGTAQQEVDNIRGLVAPVMSVAPEIAQRLACTLALLHDSQGNYRDGLAEAERNLTMLTTPSADRLGLLGQVAYMQSSSGAHVDPLVVAESDQLRADGFDEPSWSGGRLRTALAFDCARRGRPEEGEAMAQAALATSTSDLERARWCVVAGVMRAERDDAEGATPWLEEALRIVEHLGDLRALEAIKSSLSELYRRRGMLQQSAVLANEALEIGVQTGFPQAVPAALHSAADLCADGGAWAMFTVAHAAGDRIHADAGELPYEHDRRRWDQWEEIAWNDLGVDHHDHLVEFGRGLDVIRAVDLSRAVFQSIAENSPLPDLPSPGAHTASRRSTPLIGGPAGR